MLDWNDLPDDARLWVYPASRALTAAEVADVREALKGFTTRWTAHRQDLRAYGDVWHERFLVLGVDQSAAAASGCSIDASVHFVRGVGERLGGVDFFDRMLFFVRDGEAVRALPRADFEAAFARREIGPATTVFDPLVATKAAAATAFEKPLADSWHQRFV